ncbi:hypothetical protein AB0C31_24670, partial [Actinoplanes philippinensis]
SGRPLVWTVDVVVGHHADECAGWTAAGKALTIAPDESRGLRPGHVRRILAFLTGEPAPPFRAGGRPPRHVL